MANIYAPGRTAYSSKDRAISLTLGVACSIPLTSTMAMAIGPMPPSLPSLPSAGWHTHGVTTAGIHPTSQNSFTGASSSLGGNTTTAVHTAAASLNRYTALGLPTTAATGGVLNLASSKLTFLAGNLANFQNMTIDVGGRQEVVTLNTKLTGAEVVAAEQVISGAGQTIKLAATGVADGGAVSLNSSLLNALDGSVGGSISSLTIAKGVEVIDSLNVLSLSGGLSNYGSILTAAGTTGSADTITAGTIVNAAGGAIGSYSGSSAGALVGANPILNAVTSITNNGNISSAGNLTLSAPVVYNVASHGAAPSISAADNVNISTANLTNSGTIAAIAGNVNLAAASSTGLTVNGAGGTLQANSGNINLGSNNADIDVNGGNMLSQQVNFSAGTGNVTATLDQVTGVVNASGNDVHIAGNTANLDLGTIDASGDPIFTNTSNFDITGTITTGPGAPLTIIAGGNIVSTGGAAFNLDTSSATGNGGAVTMVAGATFSQPGGANTTATVTKGSASGGIIDLSGLNNFSSGSTAAIQTINTSSTAAAGPSDNGGSVQLVAYAGKTAGSGSVFTDTSGTINASSANGTAGAVSIIAGATSGTSITTGSITGSTVTVATASPTIVPTQGVTGVVFGSNGAQADGKFVGAATANAASATIGNVTGTFNANSGGTVTVNNTTSALALGTVTLGKAGSLVASDNSASITVSGIISGASATLSTTGANSITTTGSGSINTTTLNINSPGGTGTDTITTDVSTLSIYTAGSFNDTQGTATMAVGGNLTTNGSTLSISTGGQVNLTGALFATDGTLNVTTSTTDKGGINVGAQVFTGSGGNVNLTNKGTGLLTETKGIILGGASINLSSVTSVGTKAAPFVTNTSADLTVNVTGAKSVAYISDQNTGLIAFSGNSGGVTGGSLFLTSAASTMSVFNSVQYNNVSITDNNPSGGIVNFIATALSDIIGTGAGTVAVAATGGITATPIISNPVLTGTTVTLSASGSPANVGNTIAAPIYVNSPNLSLTSSQGSVFVSDSTAATVNGSASLTGTFSVTDSGAASAKTGDSLTVGKSVGGGTIDLSTTIPGSGTAGNVAVTGTVGSSSTAQVTIVSANAVTTKGKIFGQSIGLTSASGPVSVGGTVGDATSQVTLTSGSTSGITVTSPLTGNQITLIATQGAITTKAAITGTGVYTGPGSQVTLEGTSITPTGNALTIGAAITGSSIDLGLSTNGQGNIAVNSAVGNSATLSTTISAAINGTGIGGSVNGTGLVSGTLVTLSAANSIGTSAKPMQTAAGTLSANAEGTATGAGAFVAQKGNLALGSSTDTNLVVKVTGNLDVTGDVVAPNLSLTSTGFTTVDGIIQNTTGTAATTGTMTITSGAAFTVNGLIETTAGSNPVTVNVAGVSTVNGTIAVQTLDLTSKGGLNVSTTGSLTDGADVITASGPVVINGSIGSLTQGADFTITTTGSFTFGSNATVIGVGSVTAATITNETTLNADGNLKLVATGSGNAFTNYGTIDGVDITITTTSPQGVIYNTASGSIVATAQALQVSAPTINLNTYAVNNQGYIQATGLVESLQGTLNITSPGALTISGATGSFAMNYFSAVTLKAGGNIVVGGQTSNPFSNFTATNELGNFTVSTPGTYTSAMQNISVMTNTTGSFGGTISITAKQLLYNGGGTAQPFVLSATGAGPIISSAVDPITLNITGTQGITVGSAASNFEINAEGYGNTSLTTLSTPGALLINTANLDVNYTSLALTGTARVLITGDLNEGSRANTAITITTSNSSGFNVGGASPTNGNGQTGITTGQGITAGVLTINSPGLVTVGTTPATTGVGAVLVGTTSVTLNSQSLTVNNNSDIVGLSLTLNNTNTSNTVYTNITQNNTLSASAININDSLGVVTLSNGPGSVQTVVGVGTNPNGPAVSGVQLSGGAITINAQSLTYTGGLQFNATGGIDGGSVILNLSGPTTGTAPTLTIGTAAGQIKVNVAGTINDFQPQGAGTFDLTYTGNIVVNSLSASNPSSAAINFGPLRSGGNLSLIADGPGINGAGTTVLVYGANGLIMNLFELSSTSTATMNLQNAAAGGNGVVGSSITIFGGNLFFQNNGPIATNGATLSGVQLGISSSTSIIATGNNSLTVVDVPTPAGTQGGTLTLSAPFITVASGGLALTAQGGYLNGGTINVSTTTTPITVGVPGTTTGAISFDVGNMQTGSTGNYVAGSVSITSPSFLQVNGAGIIFQDTGIGGTPVIPNPGIGGSLNLTTGPSTTTTSSTGTVTTTGNNLTLTNAAGIIGLNFSTVTFNSASTGAFSLGSAPAGGNGIVGTTSVLTAGAVEVNTSTGTISAAGDIINTHALTLNAPSISFSSNQTITVQPDSNVIGVTGPLGSAPTGDGGIISLNASAFSFGSVGVSFVAEGAGAAALSASSTGGTISIVDSSTGTLAINAKTFAGFDVSNVIGSAAPAGNLQTAGFVTISNVGNISIVAAAPTDTFTNGSVFTYGNTGGSLTVTAPNIAVTNVVALSQANQDQTPTPPGQGLGLASITFNTNSATPFLVGGAATNGNGITDASPTLIATAVAINNSFIPSSSSNPATVGGINMSLGAGVQPNSLTLTTPGAVTFASGGTYGVSASVNTNVAPAGGGLGGTLTVSASSILISGTSANPVTFNAIGNSASEAGGTITFTVSGTKALTIGNGAGDLAFNVSNSNSSSSVGAGTLTIVNGGNINVDASALTFGPAIAGGAGSLALTGTNILISNIGALSSAPLASIALTTTSASDFVFGSATTNGLVGLGQALTATGLTVSANITGTLTGGINTTLINTSGSAVPGTNSVLANTLTLDTLNTITLGAALGATPNAATGAGGTITLTASALSYAGTGPTLLSAAGATGGSGGAITINDTGTATLAIAQNGGLSFNVSGAAGQTAGSVTVSSAGAITVNGNAFTFGPSPATGNAGSGSLTLTGTNLLISNVGPLNTFPLASVTLTSTSTSDFVFGGAPVNGFADIGSTLTAYAVTVNANIGGTNGAGIDATGLTTGVFTLAASIITLDTLNTITFGSNGTLSAVAIQPSGSGGTINITAGAIAYNNNGGVVGRVNLEAEGAGAGDAGGTITIADAGTSTLTIGASGLILNVSTSGGGLGGTVSVVNGGGITADGGSITLGSGFTAGSGPNLTLNANGILALSTATDVNVPNLNTLVLSSDSLQAFVLGGAAGGTNGITDAALSLAATTLSIANQGGDITFGTAAGLNSSTAMTLAASGDIGSLATPIILNGAIANQAVTLTAGGSVYINDTDSQSTTVSDATVVGALQIAANSAGPTDPGALGVGVSGTAVGNVIASSVDISYTSNNAANTNTLTLGSIAAYDGGIQASSNAEHIEVIIESVMTSFDGNITLQNTGTQAGASIVFDSGYSTPTVGGAPVITPGATLTASAPVPLTTAGNVYIVIGPLPDPPSLTGFTTLPGLTPSGVNIITNNGGALSFSGSNNSQGVNGTIKTVHDGTSSLEALGRNLVFNTGASSANAISVGSYVTITADPPGAAGVNSQTNPTAAGNLAGAGGAQAAIAGTVLGAGNGLLGAGNAGGANAFTSSLTSSAPAVIVNSSSVQPTLNISNGSNTTTIPATGLSLAAIDNVNVNSVTVVNPYIGSGLNSGVSADSNAGMSNSSLNSASNSASAQDLNGTVAEAAIKSSANRAGADDNASDKARTLSGGVSNNLHRAIDRGPILLSPLQDEVIDTPFGSISVAAHSVALIISSDDGLAVYNLHDTRKNAVVIKSGTNTVSLVPGRSVVLTKSSKSFEQVNPAKFVSYRRVASQDAGSESKLYQADFDIVSIVRGLPAVKHLMASDNAGTRKTMGNMLKTAAILSQLSSSSEPYALYLTPELTAYAASTAPGQH